MAPDAESGPKGAAGERARVGASMRRSARARRMLRRVLRRLVIAALFGLPACPSSAIADEVVNFMGAAGGADVRGTLAKPEGRGPFPAVVLLHSCLGLPANRQSIEDEITGWGYVALFVDDFGPRGLKETCTVDFPEGASDAYGALAFLAQLGSVDSSRIAAVGFSQGADTALAIAASGATPPSATPGGPTFRAAAAFYPPCANRRDAEFKISHAYSRWRAGFGHPGGGLQAIGEKAAGRCRACRLPGRRSRLRPPRIRRRTSRARHVAEIRPRSGAAVLGGVAAIPSQETGPIAAPPKPV